MTQTVENETSPIPEPGPGRPGKARRERGSRAQEGKQAPEEQPKPARTASPQKVKAGHTREHLVVGGEPRAHLLPPEVLADRRAARPPSSAGVRRHRACRA